jgi:TatD DNase family protein
MRLIDTHAHVHAAAFDADRAEVLERAYTAGVRRLINVGYDLASSAASIELARLHRPIYATAGIQPHYASATGPGEVDELRALLAAPKIVALGEIGLDYHHDRAPRSEQRSLFETQLALAAELKLPVVIHSREAHADTVDVLRAVRPTLPIVMHSFSGDWNYAKACLELGAFLSFSGPITFPKAVDLHDIAVRAPSDRILVETDCPYLSPHPLRGRRNEPARVRLVAERLAALRGCTLAEIAATVWHNACGVFALPEQVDDGPLESEMIDGRM